MIALHSSRLVAALLVAGFLLGFAACDSSDKSDIQIREAVRQYLASRTDLGRMDVELDEVEYNGDQAKAKVTIQARGDEKARLQMTYNLQRVGSEWKVQPSGGGHGGGGTMPPASGMPPGHPPTGGSESQGGGQMPPNHPPIGGGSQQQLPKGHPPVSND